MQKWPFIVTSPRYLYPAFVLVLSTGLLLSFLQNDPTQFSRTGNIIIGIGVWMSMRYTLREGINRHKSGLTDHPTINGQLNAAYFNEITFSIGDAQLQVHGFVLVLTGSLVGSYGDIFLTWLFPAVFKISAS